MSLTSKPEPKKVPKSEQTHFTETDDGITFDNARFKTPAPLAKDWSALFERFGLDENEFELEPGSAVRMGSWDQSSRQGGDRDFVQLYSFRAHFRRRAAKPISDEEVEERARALRSFRPSRVKPRKNAGDRVAAVINLADFQASKAEGGGIDGLTRRLTDGLENVQSWIDRLRASYNLEEVIIVNNGDAIEGCAGNYASQMFTVGMNHRQQYNYVLDMWDLYARTLFPQFEYRQFVSVLSNHGEMGRLGAAKNQTGDSDSADGFLAEALKRVYDATPSFSDVEWTIPHDEMNVFTETRQGVKLAFNHGHKIPGSDASGFEKWLSSQVRGCRDAWEADIWTTAHRHNFQAWDLGSCSVFQCPSMDGGSKWLRDSTGRYSTSGILAYVVGKHSKLKWSDMAFL